MALVTTPGAANADSYVSLAEFAAYLSLRRLHVPAAVTAAVDATREVALRMATRLIDDLPCPVGSAITGAVASETQALLWPRSGMTDRRGVAIAEDVVPTELKDAVSELALQLIVGDRTLDSDIETLGIESIKAGPVALTFSDDVVAKVIPDAVRNKIPASWCAVTLTSATTGIFEVIR